LYSQTGDGLREKTEPIRKHHLYFLEFFWLGLVGWVGLALWGGMFILSVRLSILAFSNWRWFEENCRPNEENIIFIFWNSWFWVGLGWVGLALYRLGFFSRTFSNLRMQEWTNVPKE